MKRLFWTAGVVLAAFALHRAVFAQGPDDGGAALRNPFDPVPVRPAPVRPDPARPAPGADRPATDIEKALHGATPLAAPTLPFGESAGLGADGRPKGLAALKPSAKDDMNRDIAVEPGQGQWMISVMSYVGPEAPQMAREFALEMRTSYKLSAFVFNYGAEERKKEYDRVKAIIDQQKKFCEDNKMPLEKVRVRYTYVPDQCAVLVGGYATEDAAHKDLKNRIRHLKPPDPRKVKLDMGVAAGYEKSDLSTERYKPGGVAKEVVQVYMNPFLRAFVAHNPSIKVERSTEPEAYDLATLWKLNKGEPYNLLECKKALTLAITHFRTPTGMQATPEGGGGVLGALGFTKKKTRQDYAATNANILADNLRTHFKLDAYVLHTQFSSVVTVGSYDSPEDPNLRSMKNLLQARLRVPGVDMFPEPYLMKVPH